MGKKKHRKRIKKLIKAMDKAEKATDKYLKLQAKVMKDLPGIFHPSDEIMDCCSELSLN